jgi:hypothetical protein
MMIPPTQVRRIVGVGPTSSEDASDWGKELLTVLILNVPVTLSHLFHRIINHSVEKELYQHR